MAEILYDGEETGAGATRTVTRQVDYGKSMYASGKADGAREAAATYREALTRVYMLVHDAWSSQRFGAHMADEAKELRREVAGVLASVGIESPTYGGLHPELDPWGQGAREEREAVVQALQQEVGQILEEEASWTFGDVASLVSEIIHGFLRGEHRKEPDHG